MFRFHIIRCVKRKFLLTLQKKKANIKIMAKILQKDTRTSY